MTTTEGSHMDPGSAERFRQTDALFDAALDLPAEERDAFVERAGAHDPELRAAVRRLLAAHREAEHFLEVPAAQFAAPLLGEATDTGAAAAHPPVRVGPYRVVREIGRGGMGTVFLAERDDGQFHQRVALKLVRGGIGSELLVRRFLEERRILAALEHPHIARLLDGGTTGDGLPYFVMEYIEGEPIDRYAAARRLTVRERLELFLRVCDAVAFAHRRLVVHRDIKPANILVAGDGTPKLLDFGIAKIVDATVVEHQAATLTGWRVLTPDYASPEQVEGRQVTGASDVYSLGVVLYELLTARSPYRFRSRSPHDIADSICRTEPEKPSTAVSREPAADVWSTTGDGSPELLRRRLRGDLDTIVLMALRKEPERRYASVEALAEDIRRHLDGLPVRARGDTLGYRAAKFVRRNRGGVAATAIAVAAVAGGAYLGLRMAHGGAEPTLVGSGSLAPRDRVLIADFGNLARDSILAAGVTELVRVDLGQSPLLQVISVRQVRSALARMERSPDAALDDSTARELALREGVKAVVTGSISQVAGTYTVTAQLVSARDGDVLAAFREAAKDSTDLVPAVDRLSKQLRRRIGESLAQVSGTPPLAQVTTASLPALRKYTEGARHVLAGDRFAGLRLLEEAVALDTGFASAWRFLGASYGDVVEPGKMMAALEHAIANQARLPFYERHVTVASYALNVKYQLDEAADAYLRILERYPDDVRALNNLAMVEEARHRYAAAETLFTRALSVDSSIAVVYMSLVENLITRGKFEAARAVLDTVQRRFPEFPNTRLGEVYLAAARQDWDTAERRARVRLVNIDPLDSLDGLQTLAGILMTRGRLREAEQHLRTELARSAQLGSPSRHLGAALSLGWLELTYRRAPQRAVERVETALARFPMATLPAGDRPYDALAQFYAAAGRPERAREWMEEAARNDWSGRRSRDGSGNWARGRLALAERRLAEAEGELRLAAELTECPICALPDLGRALEASGKRDAAVEVYERYLGTSWRWRFEPDAVELGQTLRRLGELYEAKGDRAKAAEAYGRLLQLWQGADEELQAVVREIRGRMERLGALSS